MPSPARAPGPPEPQVNFDMASGTTPVAEDNSLMDDYECDRHWKITLNVFAGLVPAESALIFVVVVLARHRDVCAPNANRAPRRGTLVVYTRPRVI